MTPDPELTETGKPRVSSLEDALADVADFFDREDTYERIGETIRRGKVATYEVTVRHHARNGLQVSMRYQTGVAGQVFYFGGLEGPSPEPKPIDPAP